MVLLLEVAGPGLTYLYGELHTLKYFWNSNEQNFIVVMIYKWHKLPSKEDMDGKPPPLGIIPKHFNFMKLVNAYNWKLVAELVGDAEYYAN